MSLHLHKYSKVSANLILLLAFHVFHSPILSCTLRYSFYAITKTVYCCAFQVLCTLAFLLLVTRQ